MIGKLSGTFEGDAEAQGGSVLIEVGGVGYVVRITPSGRSVLQQGATVELFIHTAVREDAIDLYGFPTQEELSFFKLLMSVSGIGPKTALGILTVADVPSLSRSIVLGDAAALTKIYGIGKKSAEHIVVELKDKLSKQIGSTASAEQGAVSMDGEVIEALEALGYSAAEARHALKGIPQTTSDVRERLSAALKYLGTPTSHSA